MAKRARTQRPKAAAVHAEKDVDYTIPALVAIVLTVLVTALFFAQPNVAERAGNIGDQTLGGQSVALPQGATAQSGSAQCDVMSICDGSRLIRQQGDCTEFVAYCTYGCEYRGGAATCI
jgi:hypothetical protein